MDDMAIVMTRMESKIDANNITVNAKIDNLTEKIDLKVENIIGKLTAGDNESLARLNLLQERQIALTDRLHDLEASLRRAYAFLAALALAVLATFVSASLQVLLK